MVASNFNNSHDFGQKLRKLGPGQCYPREWTLLKAPAPPPLLLPSKAFPAADEKCSIPDGQKFWWPVLWWLYESGVQYFLGSNSQSQFLASISYMNWHLPGISNFLLQQDLAKWEPLATKGLLATLAIWLMSTMVPVPHKIDAFKLYIVDSDWFTTSVFLAHKKGDYVRDKIFICVHEQMVKDIIVSHLNLAIGFYFC